MTYADDSFRDTSNYAKFNVCLCLCGGIKGLVNIKHDTSCLIVSELSDGFRCSVEFKGMEMCL